VTGRLTILYDPVGDILYLQRCPPYALQESEELGDDVIARLNPQTGEIEALEILFFSRRTGPGTPFDLPVVAELRPAV
jgi:uncharacterized protein YuzE